MADEDQATRWKDLRGTEARSIDGRAGALLRQVKTPTPLTVEQLARIEAKLEARLGAKRARLPAWFKYLVGTAAFIGAPLAFAAIARLVISPPARVAPLEAPEIERRSGGGSGGGQSAEPTDPIVALEPDLTDPLQPAAAPSTPPIAKAATPGSRTLPTLDLRPLRPLAPAPSGPPVSAAGGVASPETLVQLTAESRLLSNAQSHLLEGRGMAAIAALDEFHRKFPSPILREEETSTRIRALLALERRSEALAELDRFSNRELSRMQQGLHLLTAKAELLAHQGRLAEALSLFDELVADATHPNLHERALFGRANSRRRLQDIEGARSDLQRYLELFPQGRFSAPASDLLEGQRSSEPSPR